MIPEQYQAARIWFDYSVDDWTRTLGISRSLHGKLTGGFADVSKQTEQHIGSLMALVKATGELAELEGLIQTEGHPAQTAQIWSGQCPDCSRRLIDGPRAGLARNVRCEDADCGARFNLIGIGQLTERLA